MGNRSSDLDRGDVVGFLSDKNLGVWFRDTYIENNVGVDWLRLAVEEPYKEWLEKDLGSD